MSIRTSLPLNELVAIDVHTHAMVSTRAAEDETSRTIREAATKHFRGGAPLALDEMAAYYRERRMACVVFPVDSESGTGRRPVPNEEVLAAAAAHPDVLIPFASIDPWRGKAGVDQARRLIGEQGVRGFKFHPITQVFYPNDRRAYPLYEVIAEAGLPALFHSGQTAIGAGLPGGGGLRLKYANPMYLDDVAADFPTMPIVIAHPSVPWQDEALAVAVHKPQVYIDLSGWSPKYFPPQLVHYANTLLKDKVLFGSDYPLLTPDKWLSDFEEAGFRDEVRDLIFKQNAMRLLGLADDKATTKAG
jgi:predicted TIM-barrel fold metal-dependent hydrolase